jgi:ankyrin repeat protein
MLLDSVISSDLNTLTTALELNPHSVNYRHVYIANGSEILTPALNVAIEKCDISIIFCLLDACADPLVCDSLGRNALVMALLSGSSAFVFQRILGALGSSVTPQINKSIPLLQGHSLLGHAIAIENLDIAFELIRQGADLNFRDSNDKCALEYATVATYRQIANFLDRFLLETFGGMDVQILNIDKCLLNRNDSITGLAPIHYIAKQRPLSPGAVETLNDILSKGADPSLVNPLNGKNALHYLFDVKYV